MKTKICSNCGTSVPINARFCDKCGARLDFPRQQDPKLDERLEKIELEQKRMQEQQAAQRPIEQGSSPRVFPAPQRERVQNRNYIYHEPESVEFAPAPDIDSPHDFRRITHSTGARVGAWFLDLIIVYFLAEIVAALVLMPPDLSELEQILASAENLTPDQEEVLMEYFDIMMTYLRNWSLVFSAVFFVYNLILQLSLQATFGQLMLKMRLVKHPEMEKPSLFAVFLLSLLKCVFILLLLDVIIGSIAGLEPGQARYSNKFTNTMIVRRDLVH